MSELLLSASWERTFASVQRGLARGSYLRTINFHNTPERRAAEYEAQIARYAEHFRAVGEADLDGYLSGTRPPGNRPGLLPILFEGYRNNLWLAEVLERHGLIGWFFVPAGFPDVPVAEQHDFARAHHIGLDPDDAGGRVAMTWDELRALDERHVIACHTLTHSLLTPDSPDDLLQREIVDSKLRLEQALGHEVTTFAWLYGSEYGLNERADAKLREAGYRYLLSNFKIQKLPR